MTVLGYILLAVGLLGLAFAYVPQLSRAVPQAAALPIAPVVYAVVAVAGLVVVMLTRRTRD